MESFNNLESLREISESQLEALLRYDSPPETPNQVTDAVVILSSGGIHDGQHKNNNYCPFDSFNDMISHNREQLVSQMDSQPDFTIFHNNSPNIQWSLADLNKQINENDQFNIVTTPSDAVEHLNISVHENIEENNSYSEESFSGLDKNEDATDSQICNINKTPNDDFENIDDIFKRIDFEHISNLEFSYLNKEDKTKCQTQIELKRDLSNPPTKVIASCPAPTRTSNFIACSFMRSRELYLNQPENLFAKNTDFIEIDSLNLSNISIRKDLQFDKNLGDNLLDNIFNTTGIEHNSCCSDSDLGESQVQSKTKSVDFNHTNYSKGESQQRKPPDVKMFLGSSIPFSVRQLHEIVKSKYSDFAFVYALSSQLCQERIPMECFVTLKIALLLSLVSIGNNVDRPPIPIVAVTNDTYMTEYVMTNIGQLGSRFIGPTDDTKSVSNNVWIEADSILLAQGGVYYVGDWTRLKSGRSETIFKNIECSNIAIEKSTLNFPLQTSIWTHWRSLKYGTKDQQMFNKFLKIFGLPIYVSDDNHEALIDYTLEQCSIRTFESTVDHLSISEDDMRNFLVSVSQKNVDLSPEAAFLLKNYFVATRSIRQDCLTKQSYTMLKQFTESFAKLSMREEASVDDAVASIIMCEHFIENIFSSSDKPPPHFGNFNFVGTVDKYFLLFKEWLGSYLDKYTNE